MKSNSTLKVAAPWFTLQRVLSKYCTFAHNVAILLL